MYKGLRIVSRSKWHPIGTRGDLVPFSPTGTTFIHHTASPYGSPDTFDEQCAVMRRIDSEHLANGWDGIGYNFVIFLPYKKRLTRGLRIFEGRGLNRIPAAQENHNAGNPAICVVGNFEIQRVPDSVVAKIVSLARRLPSDYVKGHRDVNQTACPGKYLYEKLPEIRKRSGRK